MKIAVSIGNSRTTKKWNLEEMELSDFRDRIKNTIRTAETMAQYRKMGKSSQDDIKDVGGFVLGKLKGGRRKKDCVISRSGITLDMDYAEETTAAEIALLTPYLCYIYSTHKHTAEKPRLRLVIPLTREVTPDEYMAVSRKVAEDIGMELFDDTTYEPSRLMYWPSTSSDGDFFFSEIDGDVLNPDEVLARYSDWKDASAWPVSNRQQTIVIRTIKKQENPLSKRGVVGAFNRTYSITQAIDNFIPDIYKPSAMEGRYDYVPADSAAGVVIYDDVFAYSHHATDPACGKLMNAFDVVRIHKFGHLDDNAATTDASRLPSFIKMQEFATKQDAVKATLMKEREYSAKLDFKVEEDWQSKLEYNRRGELVNNLKNLLLILANDEKLKGITFNQLADDMEISTDVPWEHPSKFWRDADDAQLVSYIELNYGNFSARNYDIAVTKVTDDRSYHPIKDFLRNLPEWDGVERVDSLLPTYLGAADTPYVRAITRKTLVAAIARVMTPGIKFDTMLVLSGPQGKGKSTLIAKLCGEWFNDSLLLSDAKDKTAAEKLQGYWILEIGELAGMKKTDIETLRGFLSRQNDIYRAAFGRRATPHPRQCVFIGTTNAETYLRDITGNRRFWPVKVPGSTDRQSWEITKEEVEQIWAEALIYYEAKEPLYLPKDLECYAAREQKAAMESDDREGIVISYLETLLPERWNEMGLYERRNFLEGSEFDGGHVEGVNRRERVCVMEIWCECFGRDRGNLKRQDTNDIIAILTNIGGWKRSEGKMRFPVYGVVRGFVRDEKKEKNKDLEEDFLM